MATGPKDDPNPAHGRRGPDGLGPRPFPGRALLPTGRREQTVLVALGALAVVLAGAIVIRRAMVGPAPFQPAPGRSLQALYRIDLNSASASELQLLPGVGASLAQRIVRSRRRDGPFAAPDDLLRVRGVDEALVATLRTLVRVGPEPIEPIK